MALNVIPVLYIVFSPDSRLDQKLTIITSNTTVIKHKMKLALKTFKQIMGNLAKTNNL